MASISQASPSFIGTIDQSEPIDGRFDVLEAQIDALETDVTTLQSALGESMELVWDVNHLSTTGSTAWTQRLAFPVSIIGASADTSLYGFVLEIFAPAHYVRTGAVSGSTITMNLRVNHDAAVQATFTGYPTGLTPTGSGGWGWAGETRIVRIYYDTLPLVSSIGIEEMFSRTGSTETFDYHVRLRCKMYPMLKSKAALSTFDASL